MWIVFAIAASISWALTFVLNEQTFRYISVVTSIGISLLVGGILITVYGLLSGTLLKDLEVIFSSHKVFVLLGASILTLILAEIFIGLSIAGKNATLASLIEISYPIFIVLFSYMLFKESTLNLGSFIGGVLIFLGAATVYLFNK